MTRILTRILAVLCALMLAGCGAAKIDARTYAHAEYQASDDEYRACINNNLKNIDKCEGKRVQMEDSERAYRNMAAGATQGGNTAPKISQPANVPAINQGANTANTPQTTSSQPTLSQLPARVPPPPQQTVTTDAQPHDAPSTPTPF